jgi:pyruvate/2-oxoglutarate dehydrogenase complex dihydrolipoamide acyltransferase (E2) component
MATYSDKKGSARLFVDTTGSSLNRHFVKAPLDAARQPAIDTALGLLDYKQVLPDAFLASQRRELARLRRYGDDKDPRVIALQASIERTGTLLDTAEAGRVRIDRVLDVVADDVDVFHGFVSDEELGPREGLVVRVSADKGSASRTAKTGADGYFRIELEQRKTHAEDDAKASKVNLSERMEELLARSARDTAAAPADATGTRSAYRAIGRVEILDAKGNLLYQDPAPLPLQGGTVYREYLVGPGSPGKDRGSAFNDRGAFDAEPAQPAPDTEAAAPAATVKPSRSTPAAPKASVAKTAGVAKAGSAAKTRKSPGTSGKTRSGPGARKRRKGPRQ